MDNKGKPNVIFIMVDALRAKNLGCYGYERNTSPNIDSLAQKGVLFENAFSSNNATDKSSLSILSGRHILLGNSRDSLLTRNEVKSFFNSGGIFLHQILKEAGYKTYCLKELYGWQKKGFDFFYPIGGHIQRKNGLWVSIQGSQKFRDFFRVVVHSFPKKTADSIKARYGRTNSVSVTKDAIKIIKDSKKKREKFFMWIYYNDTHIPYNPREFTGKFGSKERKESFFKKISKKDYNPLLVKFWGGVLLIKMIVLMILLQGMTVQLLMTII